MSVWRGILRNIRINGGGRGVIVYGRAKGSQMAVHLVLMEIWVEQKVTS